MARLSDGGIGSRIIVTPLEDRARPIPWSIQSYPRPDPDYIEAAERETRVSENRLFWRRNGVMAYGAGQPHPIEEEPLLMEWDEIANPPVDESEQLPKKRERRR